MNNNTLTHFSNYRETFGKYLKSLAPSGNELKSNFKLKMQHTYRVVSNISLIASGEGFNPYDIETARIIGLFHDIGRFEQILRYGTFDDRISVDHAELGLEVIRQTGMFSGMEPGRHEIVTNAIMEHNKPAIRRGLNGNILPFAKLIRDADKMDIWKISTERNIIFALHEVEAADSYSIHNDLYECFKQERNIPVEMAQSMHDYRLLRISWIYDMHFPETFRLLIRRKYAQALFKKLPGSDRLIEIQSIVSDFMKRRAEENTPR